MGLDEINDKLEDVPDDVKGKVTRNGGAADPGDEAAATTPDTGATERVGDPAASMLGHGRQRGDRCPGKADDLN